MRGGFTEARTRLDSGISIVIPVYRSAASLPPLFQRLVPVLDSMGRAFEIVCVNDGSPDQSWEVLCELRRQYPDRLVAINLMRNYGQHSALLCGIRAARFDTVVTIDDDLQHPPEEIPRLLAELDTGFDVVYATAASERHGLWRNFASIATKRLMQAATGVAIFSKISAFRAFRTKLRDAFEDYRGSLMSIDVLLTWGASKYGSVVARHDLRLHGRSNYNFRKLVVHTFNMVTGFSAVPLRLTAYVGFAMIVAGSLWLAGLLALGLLSGKVIESWHIIAVLMTLFSGVQLLGLGAIGEYLGRMHLHAISKPGYVVDDVRAPSSAQVSAGDAISLRKVA